MFWRALRAEWAKGRRAPVWLAFVLLPLFPAVLGTANYLNNLGILKNEWYSLWSQHTLFSSYFFLPALLGVFCAWQWRLEYTGHNLNRFLTAPIPLTHLYLAKLTLAFGAACLTQGVTGGLFVLSGKVAGIQAALPPELGEWLLCGALGSLAICAAQLFLGLLFRSFAVPVALALLGGIGGMLLTVKGYGLYFPYALLSLGMRANNPNLTLDFPVFLLSSLLFILLFSLLSLFFIQRRLGQKE